MMKFSRKPQTSARVQQIRTTAAADNGKSAPTIGFVPILIRVPAHLVAPLTVMAEEARQSRNNYIIAVLERHLDAVKKKASK